MYTLTIKITKEVLKKSAKCNNDYGSNCAIAVAVRDIFPDAHIFNFAFDPFISRSTGIAEIPLPPIAQRFITLFDGKTPEERLNMSEIEFDVQIPDEAIDLINIDEIKPLLENHPHLSLEIN